jgi:hypothetical protein
MRAKPVLLPPPKAVLKPKQKTFSSVDLYNFAIFWASSDFETLGLPGWSTSISICFRWSSRLVRNLRVLIVTDSDLVSF